jgi:hypothetical protein
MGHKKILFIGGSLNQTTIVYEVSQHLKEYNHFFTPLYGDGIIHSMADSGLLEFTVLGMKSKNKTEEFLKERGCVIDFRGTKHEYDLVVTCSDLIVPHNIRGKNIVLIQEGMTDPENVKYILVKSLKLPRFFANTAMTGLSHAYQVFCVASEGFKRLFVNKGIDEDKIIVTGIPNFDNVQTYLDNDFPHKHYVLAATSCLRESFKFENRKKFIQKAVAVANSHPLIFKLHPLERVDRAKGEINRYAPQAKLFTNGNTNHMIANCDILITKYSSVSLVAAAMKKTIYSDLDQEFLKGLTPIQNGGRSAQNIADVCRQFLV